MKKVYSLLLSCLAAYAVNAQSYGIDPSAAGGFESVSLEANGWTVVNSSVNAWVTGGAAGTSAGSRAAYISKDGSSWSYDTAISATSHFYRDVAIPSGAADITLSFKWKGKGQPVADRLIVYTASTDVTPVADMPASGSVTISGAARKFLQASFTNDETYTPVSISLPSSLAGTTVRVIFTWQNNNVYGTSPACAVDEVALTYCATPDITGASYVCVGSDITLSNTETGGTWSSAITSRATVNETTGVVTGVAAGNVYITYTAPTGCTTRKLVQVRPLPADIGGSLYACEGGHAVVTNTHGGTWSSGTPSVATVSVAGLVSALSTGTTNITYTSSNTCATKSVFTVNSNPSITSGPALACIGATTTMTATPSGGTWTSAYTYRATIGYSTGIMTGVSAGTTRITYTQGGCKTVENATVNALPGVISGVSSICSGSTVTLGDATSGGTWASSNPSVATIGSTTGEMTGVSAGSATITYTSPSGCYRTKDVTVSAPVASISGATPLCTGNSYTFTDATASGFWSSSNTAVASITASTGYLTAVSSGTAIITYQVVAGCNATTTITVEATPPAISGSNNVCEGGFTTTLTNSVSGGSWISSNPAVASIGSSTGVVTGNAAGVVTISYVMSSGCYRTMDFTVNATPPATTGSFGICEGSSTALIPGISGGSSWSSSNPTVASVGLTSGVVSGLTAGTANITYTLLTGCYITSAVTVSTAPAAISGSTSVCEGGSTITLTSATSGGTWSSGTPAVATIGSSSGVVTGVAAGTAVMTYGNAGCYVTAVVTVNAQPGAISGASTLCGGSVVTFTDVVSGGTWSSSNGAVASINSSTGELTAGTTGTATISYTLGTGCLATMDVTVNTGVSAIGGTTQMCTGQSVTLTDGAGGGVWSSSNTAIATVNPGTGVVNGIATGTAGITYAMSGGCQATTIVTVNETPSAISGLTEVCVGENITLTDATTGGTWSSSNTAAGTVSSGVVTGIAAGLTVITYSESGCNQVKTVTVHPLPNDITGTTFICDGGISILLAGPTTGSTWSSSNTAVATIGATSGLMTGVGAGTSTITYTNYWGCIKTTIATVIASPPAIGGSASVCMGTTPTLTNALSGGTWSSSNTAVATINSSTGVVTPVAVGTSTITYSIGTSCFASLTITVNPQPSAITGTLSVCEGFTTSLSDATGGGTWTSGTTSVATIGSASGLVTGVVAGTSAISYTITSTGCSRTATVTVNASPAAISGVDNACVAGTSTLSSATAGGTWSSSNTGIATVGSASGLVTGVTAGNVNITYSVAGCIATYGFTVNPTPSSITGTASVCVGNTTSLSSALAGGTWSSSNSSVAFVGTATGVVTGVSAGTATISYVMPVTGCFVVRTVTVNALPSAITGTFSTCVGLTTTLSDATAGGTWSSAATGTATVGSATGVVTGVAAGNVVISYTVASTGCSRTATVTVNASPAPITGTATVCEGLTTTLSDATGSGVWSSSTGSVGTVNSATGVVTGISAGTTTVSYTVSGCSALSVVTVNTTPAAISGTLSVCEGSTTTLTDGTAGGTWVSAASGTASVGSSTGVVTGVAAGNTNISYVMTGTGCSATANVTVNTTPAGITGTASVCEGLTTTLSDATAGGTWVSAATGTATVGSATGVVTGVAAGNVNISYVMTGTGCFAVQNVTVNASPAAITGTTTVCTGSTTALADATAGGAWSSSNTTVGTISAGGVVTGLSAGTTSISYSVSGCAAVTVVTVNALPTSITGTTTVCTGLTTTLNSTPAGGTWSSSNANATVNSSTGVVTGVNGGTTATITYTASGGCTTTTTVTVNTTPSSITGTATVCIGNTTALSSSPGGGAWTSSTPASGTVDGSTGVVTGIASGTTTISYTISGCAASTVVTVNSLPGSITGGGSSFCTSVTLNCTPASGTWSSSSTSVATVGSSTGIVSAVGDGTSTITYTLGTGCTSTTVVTVSLPTIDGPLSICAIGTWVETISGTPSGGTWSETSTNIALQSAGTTNNHFRGVTAGTGVITYKVSGCSTTAIVTVNSSVTNITTTNAITSSQYSCVAESFVTVNSTPTGGVWSSSNTSVGTIDATTGVITGIALGTTTITYEAVSGSASCRKTLTHTVHTPPSLANSLAQRSGGAPANVYAVCSGSSRTATNLSGYAGQWSSSNSSIGSVGSTNGIVTGVSAGTFILTYIALSGGDGNAWGCLRTSTLTVNATPSAGTISGTTALVGAGTTSTLTSDAGTWGAWTSSAPSVATVGSTSGTVTAVANGGTVISYTLNNDCGDATSTINVTVSGARPGVIGGGSGDPDLYLSNISVFPNPNGGLFTINGTWIADRDEDVSIDIRDMMGRIVYTAKVATKNGGINHAVNLDNALAAGTYIVSLRSDNRNATINFSIMK